MEPLTRTSHTPRQPVSMTLEMPVGWFAQNGVRVGDRVTLDARIEKMDIR